MRQHQNDLNGVPVKGALRPLRGVWIFTWLILAAAGAVKLAMELLDRW